MFLSHFPAFRYRDFRIIWFSQVSNAITAVIYTIAVSWQLFQLTHSTIALGLVGVFEGVPFLLFNLLGGNFADVHNRKKILYITEAVFSLSSFLLAIATFLHIINPFIIYFLTIFAWIALAFDMPARHALLPSVVPKEDLASANSTYSLLWQAVNVIGPVMGGFLIAGIGVGAIYLLDGIANAIFIWGIHKLNYNGEPHGEKTEVSLRAIKDGFSFLFSKEILWTTKLLDAVSVLFASCVILFPVYATEILHVGAQGLGLLYAAPAVGGVIMGVMMSRYVNHVRQQGKWLLVSVAIYALATILFGLSTNFALSLFVLAISGAANIVSVAIRSTITQLHTPNDMLGRMDSLSSIFWMGGDKLGDIEGGFLANVVGAPFSVVFGGIAAVVIAGSMWLFTPALRNYEHKVH